MEIPDAWDDTPSSQRKYNRYHARWKVMLVFGLATKIPNYQSLIHDLSLTGISVQYHSDVKEHTVLTLLLAFPPKDDLPRKVIKLKAEVISSKPYRASFRLGMVFINNAELDDFRQRLGMYVISDELLYSDIEADEFPQLNF